jgi:hypothetical protein
MSIVMGSTQIIIILRTGSFSINSIATFLSAMLTGTFLAISIFTAKPPQTKQPKICTKNCEGYAIQTINASKDYILGPNTVSAVKNLDPQ